MGGAQEFSSSWMEDELSSIEDKDKSLDDSTIDYEEKMISEDIVSKSSTDPYLWDDQSSNSQEPPYDGRKERLVIKFRRISQTYYMVDETDIPEDSNFRYFNYKSIRYSFPTSFNVTPRKNNNPKVVRCKTCRKVFSKMSTLKIHRRTHAAFAPGPYTPKDFAKRFSTGTVSREPYRPAAHLKLLESVQPHPREYAGYFASTGPLPFIKPGSKLQLSQDLFSVGDMIGEGGFAKVYSACWENGPPEEQKTVLKVQMPANDWEWYILSQVHTRFDKLKHPLKEDKGTVWKGGFMSGPRCYTYRDGAVIISAHQKMGTLLDLVNLTKNADKSIIEPIAIYLTAELLGLMELLHSIDIVHADLKPDNFLVRHVPSTQSNPSLQLIDFGKAIDLVLEPGDEKQERPVGKEGGDATTEPAKQVVNGEGNLSENTDKAHEPGHIQPTETSETKAVVKTDADNTVNTEVVDASICTEKDAIVLPVDKCPDTHNGDGSPAMMNGNNDTSNSETEKGETLENDKTAVAQVKGRKGKYHLDYFGIAGAAYCLLFGKYIEVGTVKNRWVVKGSFKRWWQVKVWEQFFDDMLNPKDEGRDCLPSLLEWREKFLELFQIEELRDGLVKAREIIEIKLLEKWRRTL